MSGPVRIRRAEPEEAAKLSDLAMRSKAHWGYSSAFLESCRFELSVTAEQLRSPEFDCNVASDGHSIAGFYSLVATSPAEYELEALFVDPERIGQGIGRMLVDHAIELLSTTQARTLVIQGDPHATEFYLAMGARQTGERESGSVPGRYLPVFEIDVRDYMTIMA